MVAESSWSILRRYYKLPYTPPRFWIRLVSRLVISFKGFSKSYAEKVESQGRRLSQQSSYWSTTSEDLQMSASRSGYHPSSDIASNDGSPFSLLSSSYDEELETEFGGYSHSGSLRLTESWQTAYFMDKNNRYCRIKGMSFTKLHKW